MVAGSVVTALPANPDTARGFSADVFLDEFAWHHDSRGIWGALFPVVSAGHRLIVTSTPNGKGNKFYALMTDKAAAKIWSRHTVDIHQAVADGLPRDVDALQTALADDELWRQEYELEWLDEASAWLPHELIMACEHPHAGEPSRSRRGRVSIGNDIAARGLWVAAALEEVGDVAWTRELRERKGASFAKQDAALDEMHAFYGPRLRIHMDQTGMGEKPVEDAIRRYGASMVEGVILTPGTRLDLATALRRRFEDRAIRIPAGRRELRADLHAVKRIAGPTGHPRLVIDDAEARGAGGHADRFWAMALAAGGLEGGVPAYDYQAVRDGDYDDDDDDAPARRWGARGGSQWRRAA